ncbi:melanoma-associated antigen 8-like, partial [Lynx canadensis]|uniref:melanoma-associated antigen 8-like n=1 Tax=Lynx canadensis TaxID=61383 RepID=UPI0011AFD636
SSSSSSPSSPSSSCSVLILVPLEEGSAAAGSPSPPQSPRSSCPSPSAMAGASGSQSHPGSSSPDEEGSSTWGAPAGPRPPPRCAPRESGRPGAAASAPHSIAPISRPTRAEMLAAVSQDDQDRFPVIFRRACEYLQLVFGVDVKEVDPREHSYVLEGYLEYRQVPGSEPARYEFLWGPRAHAETSAVQVLQHILAVNSRQPGSPCLSEEAVSHEEERA